LYKIFKIKPKLLVEKIRDSFEDFLIKFLKFLIRRNPISPIYALGKVLRVKLDSRLPTYRQAGAENDKRGLKKNSHLNGHLNGYFSKQEKYFSTHHPYWSAFSSFVFLVLVFSGILWLTFFRNFEKAQADWWDDTWHYRKVLTIDSDQVAGDLTDFPMLVSFTDSDLGANAQSDGDDIVFTLENGTKLDHEIESYTTGTGVLVAWVRIPELDGDNDSYILMYYGNSTVSSQENVSNVWNDNYSAVWHMNGGAGASETDSTKNNNDLSVTGTVGNGGSTKVGPSRETANGNNYLSISDNDTLDGMSKLTIQAWIRDTQNDTQPRGIVSKRTSSSSQVSYTSFVYTNRYFNFDNGNSTGTGMDSRTVTDTETCTVNTWQMLHFTFDGPGDTKKIYLDGTEAISDSTMTETSIYDGTGDLRVGILNDSYGNSWVGQFDEVRIVQDALSSNWIETEHNNQDDPATFFSAGSEEVGPGPIGYWSFDEGYGTTAHDESGEGHDAAITGATWKTEEDCISGKCLYFDGGGDYVLDDDGEDYLNGLEEVSLSLWVRSDSVGHNRNFITGSAGGGDIAFTGRYDSAGASGSGTNVMKFGFGGASDTLSSQYESSSNIQTISWQHIVATWKNGEAPKLYVDGVLDTATWSDIGTATSLAGLTELRIGSGVNGVWTGFIDEVKIYPYVRTAEEVKQDYNAGLSGQKSLSGTAVSFGGESDKWMSDGLVGYWKMDEASWNGTTDEVVDSSGKGNHGVRSGDATTAGGKFGKGGTFDGSGDYVYSSDDVLSGASEYSISFWMNRDSSSSGIGYIMYLGGLPYVYSDDSNGHLRHRANDTNLNSSNLSDDTWYHVVVMNDGSTSKIYINGELDAQAADTIGNHSEVYIGRNGSSGNSYFYGKLDEIRVYNRALSPREVKKLYEWAPGPVLHLKMDEGSWDGTAGEVVDISGNGYHGTASGSATTTRGKFGKGASINGSTNDYVGIGQDVFSGITKFTISMWYKRPDNDNAGYIFYGIPRPYIYDNSSTIRTLSFRANTGSVTTSALNDDTWYYLTFTNDGSLTKVYINGVFEGEIADSLGTHSGLYFGYDGGTNYMNANMDDVRIYDYVRTQDQILEDMNGGGPAQKSPVLHLSFDEGFGDTAYDSSGFGNDGTLDASTGGTNTTETAMWEKSGKIKGAMELDGTDDYINAGSDTSLDNMGDMTITAWVKPYSLGPSNYGRIADKDNTANGDGWLFAMNSSNRFYFSHDTTSTNVERISANNSITLNEWQHLAVTWDGDVTSSTGVRLYLNGVETAYSSTLTPSGSAGDDSANNLCVANRCYDYARTFDGLIDELKIWNYALTAEEVVQEYQNSGSAVGMGGLKAEADNDGTTVTGASAEYCIPGDTAQCDPPVLELKMDEKTGVTTYDTSGNGNDGTLTDGPTWTRGKYGSAVRFDGSDDYIDAGTDSSLDIAGELTLSAWINPSLITGDNRGILGKGKASGADNQNYRIYIDGSTTHLFFVAGASGSGESENSNVDIPINEWTFINVTVDETANEVRFYINGILRSTNSFTATMTATTEPLIIGEETEDAPAHKNWFNGLIDDVRIYNYVRTPAQIAWDYNRGGPVGHWKFDECQGSTIHDESGNGNDGTLSLGASGVTTVGTCSDSASSFWYNGRSGKTNSSGSFDGTDDYVDCGYDDIYDFASDFTITAWIKPDSFGDGNYGRIVDKLGSGTNGYSFYLNNNPAGTPAGTNTLSANIYGTVDTYNSGNDNIITTGEWQHVAVSFNDVANYVSFYVNGLAQGGYSYVGTLSQDAASLRIGDRNALDRSFDGQIDDVRIYNYALTAGQIKNIYNDGAVGFR